MWGPEKAIFENLLFLFLETYDCWSEASSVSVVARACSSEFSCIVLYFCPFSKKKKLQAVNREKLSIPSLGPGSRFSNSIANCSKVKTWVSAHVRGQDVDKLSSSSRGTMLCTTS